jgi:5'-nucleotidase
VPTNVVFLHWNDFHGQFRPQLAFWKARGGGDRRELPEVGGAAALAGYVARTREQAEAAGQHVVVTDGGDWYQGTIEGNEDRGRLAVEFLSRLSPDAVVLGNHEYDFGPENVRALVAAARFPVLGANVLQAGAKERKLCDYVVPFQVVPVRGLKVAVVGLITARTKDVSTGPWGEAEFGDEIEALRAVLPAAAAASDVVVLLTHCGLEKDRELAQAFPAIPLILGGHSHTGLKEPFREGGTWIVQTHGKASEVYRVEAHVDAARKRLQLLRGELVELDRERHPDDPATAAWIAESTKDLAASWDRVIGELRTPLDDDRGARSTAAGNLVCDAFAATAGADLGFSNKGGIRTRLRAGPLSPRMLYELLPFDNNLVSFDLTGAQIRAILQASVGSGRRLLEIGGGTYRYTVRDGQRVLVEVRVGGAPLDDAKTYRVATSSFLARGGDGLEGFAAGTNRKDHGILLRDVLIRIAERDKELAADPANRILFDEPGK